MSNTVVYDVDVVENAMRCLLDMHKLEETLNFGKLTYKPSSDIPNNRYNIEEYKDRIDSTFYTDMSTSTLIYTIDFLRNNFLVKFDIPTDVYNYGINNVDLINDSESEFANFNGDSSILELDDISEPFKLYAYYNEFDLIIGDEREKFFDRYDEYLNGVYDYTGMNSDYEIILKKNENINGSEVNFYYVSDIYWDISEQMLQHDYNVEFLRDRISGGVLESAKAGYPDIDTVEILTFSKSCFEGGFSSWAGMNFGPSIFIANGYFDYAICHEIGHGFDHGSWNTDEWNMLAQEYADDISMITDSFVGIGYSANEMKVAVSEFYAESFQCYFYSEETKAALPNKIRVKLDKELEKYI